MYISWHSSWYPTCQIGCEGFDFKGLRCRTQQLADGCRSLQVFPDRVHGAIYQFADNWQTWIVQACPKNPTQAWARWPLKQNIAKTHSWISFIDPMFPSAPLEAFAATVGGANGTAAAAAATVGGANGTAAAAGAAAGASSSLLSSLGLRVGAEAAEPNLETLQGQVWDLTKQAAIEV